MPVIEYPDGMTVAEALEFTHRERPDLFASPAATPAPRGGGESGMADAETLMTPGEVAAAFRVDPKTVTRWAKDGKLGSIRTPGGHRRYRAAEVRALLTGCPRQPAA
jgi:excisionase family DNA binding protein